MRKHISKLQDVKRLHEIAFYFIIVIAEMLYHLFCRVKVVQATHLDFSLRPLMIHVRTINGKNLSAAYYQK